MSKAQSPVETPETTAAGQVPVLLETPHVREGKVYSVDPVGDQEVSADDLSGLEEKLERDGYLEVYHPTRIDGDPEGWKNHGKSGRVTRVSHRAVESVSVVEEYGELCSELSVEFDLKEVEVYIPEEASSFDSMDLIFYCEDSGDEFEVKNRRRQVEDGIESSWIYGFSELEDGHSARATVKQIVHEYRMK